MVSADTDFFNKVYRFDLVFGSDNGKGKFRLVLMIILRIDNPVKTVCKRFIFGKIECMRDTAEVLKNYFMKEQNEPMEVICKEYI